MTGLLGLGLVAGGVHVALTPPSVTATAFSAGSPGAGLSAGSPGADVATGPVGGPAGTIAPRAGGAAPLGVPSRPTRLRLPRLGVAAVVRPVGADRARTLALPSDPRVVGWYAGSASPGSATGSTVVAGHVDRVGWGPGVLTALTRLGAGDRVELTLADGQIAAYRVTSRLTYPKASLPGSVFRLDGRPVLTLITCGGPFDARTHHYRDNIVVTAVPVS